jgi:hypothetical protein
VTAASIVMARVSVQNRARQGFREVRAPLEQSPALAAVEFAPKDP